MAYSGGSLGAIITPIVITPVALWWGWRAAFLFTGLVGAGWITLWLFVSRRPDVRAHRPAQAAEASKARPHWRDPRLWSFMLAYALCALPIGFVIYGAAIFLHQELGKTQAQIGQVLWLPPLGWEIGYFFWGALSDRMRRAATEPLSSFRRLMTAAAVLSLPLALTPRLPSFPLVLAELFLAMFVAAGFIILAMAYATHVYSSSHAGLIAGLGAGAWSAAVALPVAGYLIWLWVNRGSVQQRTLAGNNSPRPGF